MNIHVEQDDTSRSGTPTVPPCTEDAVPHDTAERAAILIEEGKAAIDGPLHRQIMAHQQLDAMADYCCRESKRANDDFELLSDGLRNLVFDLEQAIARQAPVSARELRWKAEFFADQVGSRTEFSEEVCGGFAESFARAIIDPPPRRLAWQPRRPQRDDTPMMRQYLEIKADWPDHLLFYRMGQFHELFFEDAENAAEVLDIRLTKRGSRQGQDVPMSGVPGSFGCPNSKYVQRLVDKGFKIAICERIEDPSEAKEQGRAARRQVVREVTPDGEREFELMELGDEGAAESEVAAEQEPPQTMAAE